MSHFRVVRSLACLAALLLQATWPAAWAQAVPARPQAADEADGADNATEGADRKAAARRAPRSAWKLGVDHLMLEGARLGGDAPADSSATLRLKAFATWQPNPAWELRLGVQAGSDVQRGGPARAGDDSLALGETYLRYRSGDMRLTAGAMTVVWGRADAVPIIDRVSRVDLRRGLLDDLNDRRLPVPALRWEQSFGDHKLDAMLLGDFRAARTGDRAGLWQPIDRRLGRIAGVEVDAASAAFVRFAALAEDEHGQGGAAVRYTRTGEPLDFGITLARTRQSLPYFQLEPARLRVLAVHPLVSFAGVDAEIVSGGTTWRTELGFSDGVPLTNLGGGRLKARAIEWIGGVEFFPGGGNTRVNLQLLARSHRVGQPVLQLKNYVGLNGELETSFDQGRWKAGLRFASGLNVHDLYLAPKISFVGWEPHEFYLVLRRLGGEARTIGGFYDANDMIAIGVKTRF